MLRRDVTLPLVLGGEGGRAACKCEDADEGSGVGGCVVALESCCVFEGRVVAGSALVLAFGGFCGLVGPGTLGGKRTLGGGGGALPGAGGLGRVLVILVFLSDDDIAIDVTFGVCIGVG